MKKKAADEEQVFCEVCGCAMWRLFKVPALMLSGENAGSMQTVWKMRCALCKRELGSPARKKRSATQRTAS